MNLQRYHKLLISIVLILIVALIAFVQRNISLMDEQISVVLQLMEVVGIAFTITFTILQLYDSKEIAKATFVVELNQNYVENSDYMDVYNKLQAKYDDESKNTDDISKGSISNYLTFFETIYILKNRGVISLKVIDDLFAYRFFLAVHSELFQEQKLRIQPENFKNIYLLEKEWLDYRVKKKKIEQDELNDAVNRYRDALENKLEKTLEWDNVYLARPLAGLFNEDDYEKILKGIYKKPALTEPDSQTEIQETNNVETT